MDTALRDVMTKANEAMEDAIQNMQLSKFKYVLSMIKEDACLIDAIHLGCFSHNGKSENSKVNFFLLFKDRTWELPYLLRPDLLFGSYIIGAIPVIISIFIMQFVLFSPR